jgi:hypothetical protein
MIEQKLMKCSIDAPCYSGGVILPYADWLIDYENKQGWRAISIAYSPHREFAGLIIFEKMPVTKVQYNEVDI